MGNLDKILSSILSKAFLKLYLKIAATSIFVIFIIINFIHLIALILFDLNNFSLNLHNLLFTSSIILIISMFIFPFIQPIISCFFENQAVALVEKNYPLKLAVNSDYNTKEMLLILVKSSFLIIGLNILMIIFYIIPLINLFCYYILNSYLIGNLYFKMIFYRYYSMDQYPKFFKQNYSQIILVGFVIVLSSNIPILNLISPLLAIIITTHTIYEIYSNSNIGLK